MQLSDLISRLYVRTPELKSLVETNFLDLTLIGGTVRDALIKDEVSKDLDFEIRYLKEGINLENLLESIFKVKVENLNFNVFRVKVNDIELEFSLPRIEAFMGQEPFGHSDVTVTFDSSFDYQTSFRRRDFSINAIGLNLNNEKVVDPYSGMDDIKSKVLKPLSDEHFNDPVRFLRAIRFKNLLGMSFDSIYFDNLSKFNLSKLSKFYFLKESFKVNHIKFVKEFLGLIEKHKIEVGSEILKYANILSAFDDSSSAKIGIIKSGVENGLSDDEVYFITSFLDVRKKTTKKLKSVFRKMKDGDISLDEYELEIKKLESE